MKTKTFLGKEILWVLMIAAVGMGLSLWPTVYEIRNKARIAPGKVQLLEHNFVPDYNFYLSRMLQGAQGGWMVYETFTNEPHSPSLLQIFYLMLGKVGGWLGLTMPMTYLWVGRIGLGLGRLISGYIFIRYSLKGTFQRVLAFGLFVLSGGFPLLVKTAEGYRPELYLPFWSQLQAIVKITFLPHWLFGQMMMAFSVSLVYRCLTSKMVMNLSLAILAGLALGFAHPSGLVAIDAVLILLAIYIVFSLLLTGKEPMRNARKGLLPAIILFVVITIYPLVYIKRITNVYPWKAMAAGQSTQTMEFPYSHYFLALGATFYLGMAGALWYLVRGTRKSGFILVSAFWVGATLVFIVAFDKLRHYDQLRFIQVFIELPLAVLSVYLLAQVVDWVREKAKALAGPMIAVLVVLIFLPTLISGYVTLRDAKSFLDSRLAGSFPEILMNGYFVYPIADWMEAIYWLRDNSRESDVVLSGPAAGNYIPAYSGNFVYIGHGHQTVNFDGKRAREPEFYSGKMSEEEAAEFVRRERVSWVFYGPEEEEWGMGFERYGFLKKGYEGSRTKVFRVVL